MNFYSDVAEWKYLIRNAIDWETLIPLYYPNFPTPEGLKSPEEVISFFEDLLTATGKWTAESVAPRARQLDEVGGGKLVDGHVQISDVLQATYREAKELDLFGFAMDPRYGGLGAPVSIGLTIFTQLCRACVSSATQIAFHTAIADMIERFCDEKTQKKYLPMIRNGEISGAMCMTEPDAGSDVGSLRTSAQKQPDGSYRLNGTKCFITNGGGGLGFVLARIQGAPKGLEGISMFLVEEWLDDPKTGKKTENYRIAKVEDKMGMHGSPTCEVVYENSVGYLVGQENEGFKLMLHLMNEARISVGLQGLGGMEASVGAAREYAETRKQFGKPIAELPLMKRNLQDWETERDAFRALMVDTLSYFDLFQKLDLKKRHTGDLNEKETALLSQAKRITRRRTPLVKYYGAEANTLLSQRAIQAFGGYGYMNEYDVGRLHRDSFGALLYEGTSQIQALMAMKDFLKEMMSKPGKFFQGLVSSHPLGSILSSSEYQKSYRGVEYEFRKNIASLVVKCFKPEFNLSEAGFKDILVQINQVFSLGFLKEAERFDKLMVHAETLCQALSYCETLKVLSKHALKDPARGDLYYRYLGVVKPRLAGIYEDWRS